MAKQQRSDRLAAYLQRIMAASPAEATPLPCDPFDQLDADGRHSVLTMALVYADRYANAGPPASMVRSRRPFRVLTFAPNGEARC